MARKPQDATQSEAAQSEKPKTGTERVFAKGGVVIPGPALPAPMEGPKPHEKVKEKKKEDKPAPFVIVPSQHIIKTLSINLDRNRQTRLTNLARINRDVAWLLSEFETLKPKTEKSK